MKTLDDAIDALQGIDDAHNGAVSRNVETLREFLTGLKAKAEPLKIGPEAEGFLLEHAMQAGFDTIDDDADLFVVSGRKLVDFVTIRQGAIVRAYTAGQEAPPM